MEEKSAGPHPRPPPRHLYMTTSNCSNCGHVLAPDDRFCPACGTQVVTGDSEHALLGKTLNGKYRVLTEIGSGSMVTVFLGEHIGQH